MSGLANMVAGCPVSSVVQAGSVTRPPHTARLPARGLGHTVGQLPGATSSSRESPAGTV